MAIKFPSRTLDKFLVRLPEGMRGRLAEAAKTNKRTMNAELVSRLEQSFDREERDAVSDQRSKLAADRLLAMMPGDTSLAERVTLLEKEMSALKPRRKKLRLG